MASVKVPDARHEDGNSEPFVKYEAGAPIKFSLDPLVQFDPKQIIVEPVQPVDERFGRFGGRCLALRNVLTMAECQYLISEMSNAGQMEQVRYRHDYRQNDRCVFESKELARVLWQRVEPIASTLAVAANTSDPSEQILLDQKSMKSAEDLDASESGGCPEQLQLGFGNGGIWRPIGLNECLRFCRYNPGGFFRPHCDACFKRSDEERSLFTCMFYLDGSFNGGATRFLRIDGDLTYENYLRLGADDQVLASLQPEAGLCLLFFQPGLLHEGEDVNDGSKHILRTDVMFRRDPGTGPSRTPQEQEAWEMAQEAQIAEAAGECDRACQLYRRAFKLDPKLERMF